MAWAFSQQINFIATPLIVSISHSIERFVVPFLCCGLCFYSGNGIDAASSHAAKFKASCLTTGSASVMEGGRPGGYK